MPVATCSDSARHQANDLDLIFLKGIMESPLAQEHLEEEQPKLEAVGEHNVELVHLLLEELSPLEELSAAAAELAGILKEPHFQSLLETHDSVASKSFEAPPPDLAPPPGLAPPPDAVRMVGVRRVSGEHLGVTFRVECGQLVIARVLHGGAVAQQGLLREGDVLQEVNDQEVRDTEPRALQELLRAARGSVLLKVLPSYKEPRAPRQAFVRCHFDYNPAHDQLIPCQEAGLSFARGDILQLVNQEDLNWWQACPLGGGSAGLIPSQLLEEKRKAFVRRDQELTGPLCAGMSGRKKKKKIMYLTTKNAEFDRHELRIYEEVAKMAPFRRKTLVLIGAQGVGRRRLKEELLLWAPGHYATTTPFTSRKPRLHERDGLLYSFSSRSRMEEEIRGGGFLEHGDYGGHLYGTSLRSVQEVLDSGRVCVLDVSPQALKVLRTAAFLPYVVFVEAPDFQVLKAANRAAILAGVATKQRTDSELRRTVDESERLMLAYGHLFDLRLGVGGGLDTTFRDLRAALERLATEQQWVPVSWVF